MCSDWKMISEKNWAIHAIAGECYSSDEDSSSSSSSSSSNSSETSSSLVSEGSVLIDNNSDAKEDVESLISFSVDESKSNESLKNKKDGSPSSTINESITEEDELL